MSGGLKVVPATTSIFRDDILRDRVAFVTGGGSGICRAMAEAMVRHGAKACIVSRTQERLDKAAREMMSAVPGSEVLPIAADVRKPDELEAAAKKCVEKFGRIDIVVCGAAGNFLAPAEKLSYNAFKTVIEIDLLGSYNTVKACFPYLKESGAQTGNSSIIAVTATLHYRGAANQIHPVAAKAGIDAMIRTLSVEWGPYGIRSNIIAPGPIAGTEGMDRLAIPELLEQLTKNIPMRTLGAVGDIAHATLYLASAAARYVSGTILIVDGGSYLTDENKVIDFEEARKKGFTIARPQGRGKI